MAGVPMQRFLVRRATGEVFIWTEMLSRFHRDLDEVYAETAQQALERDTMPDPGSVSQDQVEAMDKATLIIFGTVKLGLKVDASHTKAQLQDQIKLAIFMRGQPVEQMTTGNDSRPFPDARAMVGRTGLDAQVQTKSPPAPKFAPAPEASTVTPPPPASAETQTQPPAPQGAQGASDHADQPLRT